MPARIASGGVPEGWERLVGVVFPAADPAWMEFESGYAQGAVW